MLRLVLKFLRPSYALTGLILLGGWQGYSMVKSASEPVSSEQVQADQVNPSDEDAGPITAAIRQVHPAKRIGYWLILYGLICLATAPVINKVLARESNLANAMMLVVYIGVGLGLAILFTAFQFNWVSIILIIGAAAVSSVMIIKLAVTLEKLRVES